MDETIKVTDKRMFNSDGSPRGKAPAEATKPEAPADVASDPSESTRTAPRMPKAPMFEDLLGLLAQPVAMLLGAVEMPDGESAENLPLARYHLELLELLQSKTRGNLTASEEKAFESLLYQLRMHYVEKSG